MGIVIYISAIKDNKATMRAHKVTELHTLVKPNVYEISSSKNKSFVSSYKGVLKKTKKLPKKAKNRLKRLKKI